MRHIKLFEEFEIDVNIFDEILKIVDDDKIASDTEKEIKKDGVLVAKLDGNNEAVLATLAIGAALSLGKVAHLASAALTYIGMESSEKVGRVTFKMAEWLKHKGDIYTAGIFKLILRISNKIPLLKNFIDSLNGEQKKTFGNVALTVMICIVAGKLSDELLDSFLSTHDVIAELSNIDTVNLAKNFEDEMPKIIKATVEASIT